MDVTLLQYITVYIFIIVVNPINTLAGLTPFEPDTPPQSPHRTVNENETSVSTQGKPMKPVSYDDYHILWKGIATSITDYKRTNQCKSFLIHHIPDIVLPVLLLSVQSLGY